MHTEPTPTSNPLATPTKEWIPSPRMAWVDNLRTAMILLVVNMHACVTYSHVGGWFITLPPEPSLEVRIPFLLWQGHMQSFFMGLLFFIAGYFAEKSIVRKGTGLFLRERWMRLGVPTLFFMLVILPLTVWGIIGYPKVENVAHLVRLYRGYTLSGAFLSCSGPLWFTFALLLFSLVFAALQRISGGSAAPRPTPDGGHFLLFCAGLVSATFLARLAFPLETSFLNFQLSYFAQYIVGFWVGVLSARHGWLSSLADSPLARRAGMVGLVGGPILLLTVVWLGGSPGHKMYPYGGGWHWQAFGLAFWEQMTGPALGLGMLHLFSRHLGFQNSVTQWLSKHSFGVFVLHTPILVALALWGEPWNLTPFVGSVWLTFGGLVASYAAAALALKLPGLRAIL
jgi:fucose 4-O-acetylase-like acetyltransferase